MGHKNSKANKKNIVKETKDPMIADMEKKADDLPIVGPGRTREYIDIACVLIAIIAVEILLGIMLLKQPIPLLLIVMGLNLVLALISNSLHPYFLFAIIAIQLVAGGLSAHTVIAIEGIVIFSVLSFAIRKFLK